MPELSEVFGRTHMMNFSVDQIKYQDGTKVKDPFNMDINEEVEFAANRKVEEYQGNYISRLFTTEASKKLVNETFDWNSVRAGAEFGSGIYGWFYNYLLPGDINWQQFDISPRAVKLNRQYTKDVFGKEPSIEVGNIYDMPLKNESVDVIAGLSTWDSIGFFDKAIKEVERCLRPGGHFVHYQEAMVPDKVFILAEAEKRMEKGLGTDMKVEVYSYTVEHPMIPGMYRQENMFVAFDTLEYGRIKFGDYLTKHVASLFENRGYDVLTAEEKSRDILVKEDVLRELIEFHDFDYESRGNNYLSAYGKSSGTTDSSVPEGHVRQRSFMDLLIVKKPE